MAVAILQNLTQTQIVVAGICGFGILVLIIYLLASHFGKKRDKKSQIADSQNQIPMVREQTENLLVIPQRQVISPPFISTPEPKKLPDPQTNEEIKQNVAEPKPKPTEQDILDEVRQKLMGVKEIPKDNTDKIPVEVWQEFETYKPVELPKSKPKGRRKIR